MIEVGKRSWRVVSSGDEIVLRDTSAVRRLFSDKWSPVVLAVLAHGPLRRSAILSTVNALAARDDAAGVLHDSTLARTLRRLIDQQLIDRRAVPGTFPPRVFYALRPAGQEYLELERRFADWFRRHGDVVDQRDDDQLGDGQLGDGQLGDTVDTAQGDGIEGVGQADGDSRRRTPVRQRTRRARPATPSA